MKKYVKPELFFERYELNQQIAACDFDSNNTANDEGCKFSGIHPLFNKHMILFLTKEAGCDTVPDSYCYHNTVDSPYGLFNS